MAPLTGLVLLNILNLIDAYYTYIGVSNGYLVELNPLMEYLLVKSSFLFFACKIALVGLASSFLYLRRDHTLSRVFIWFGCALYFGIGLLHAFHLSNL